MYHAHRIHLAGSSCQDNSMHDTSQASPVALARDHVSPKSYFTFRNFFLLVHQTRDDDVLVFKLFAFGPGGVCNAIIDLLHLPFACHRPQAAHYAITNPLSLSPSRAFAFPSATRTRLGPWTSPNSLRASTDNHVCHCICTVLDKEP